MKMKLESYEPYHIGIKLKPHVILQTLKKQLKEKLKNKGYVTEKDTATDPLVIPSTENLGTKDGVDVIINYGATAINSIGVVPNQVIRVFDEISNLILECGYEQEATVSFYEILATVNIKTKNKSVELLNKVCRLDLKSFDKLGRLNVLGLRLGDKLETSSSELTEVIIQPKPTSPTDKLLFRIVYRTPKKEELEKFHANLEGNLSKLMSQF